MTKTLLSLACAGALLHADTLPQTLIQSDPLSSDLLHAPYAAHLYTREQIQSAHVRSIYEFLNQMSAITTAPAYGNHVTQQLDLHGYGLGETGYENIVILLNGHRLNAIDMTPQLLNILPIDAIASIEILTGAGAALYGDGATSAVINITTQEHTLNTLRLEAGNHNTRSASLYLSSLLSRGSYALYADQHYTDGTRHYSTTQTDSARVTTGGFEGRYRPNDDLALRTQGSFSYDESYNPAPMTLSEFTQDPSSLGSAGYGSHQNHFDHHLSFGGSYALKDAWLLDLDGTHQIKQSTYVGYTPMDYRSDELRASLNYHGTKLNTILGANLLDASRTNGTNRVTKKTQALYLSSAYTLGEKTLSLSGRIEQIGYDYDQASQNTLSSTHTLHALELGYNHPIDTTLSLFAHVTRAYQAPDVDRFFTYNWGSGLYVFNGFIDPMKTMTYTLGGRYRYATHQGSLSVYYVDLHDEIYYYPDPTYTHDLNTNIDRSHKYGLDLSDEWRLDERWDLSTHYAYTQAIIDQESQNGDNFGGKTLPGVSHHTLKTTLRYQANDALNLSVSEVYRSAAYALGDFSNSFAQKQREYTSTNLALTYTQSRYELYAKLDNLFAHRNGLWIRDNAIYPTDYETMVRAGIVFKW